MHECFRTVESARFSTLHTISVTPQHLRCYSAWRAG